MKKIAFNQSNIIRYIISGTLAWVLIGFILYPVLRTLEVSLYGDAGLNFEQYLSFFSSESYRMALKNSIVLGLLTVFVCGIIGTLLAFLIHYFEMPYSKLFDKLLLLPVVLPGLIIVFAFVQLYGESGLITKTIQLTLGLEEVPYRFMGLKGILFVHAYTQYVYFYMNVALAIRHIDRYTIEAARNLGASRRQVFWTIILPYIRPALIASSVITFMTGIGSFSAPSIIGGSYKVLTTQILLSKANNYLDMAATQVIVLTIVSLVYLGLSRSYENKIQFTNNVKGIGLKPQTIRNPFIRGTLMTFMMMLVVFILLPIITIILLSFVKPGTWMIEIYPKTFSMDNYSRIFTKSRALAPFINSSVMAGITAGLCIMIAVPASYIVVKTKSRLKVPIELLVMLPWAIPSSAIAVNMINAFNRPTIFTGNHILVGQYILLPIAYTVSLLPLMFRSTTISLQNLNDVLIEASKSLRANPFQTFRRIVLPSVAPGIMSGTMLIVIRTIGEYTISAFLYTVDNKPISIAMVNGIFDYKIGLTMAYGTLVVLFALIISAFINRAPEF